MRNSSCRITAFTVIILVTAVLCLCACTKTADGAPVSFTSAPTESSDTTPIPVATEAPSLVVFSSGTVSPDAEEATLCLTEEDIPLLEQLPCLKILHAEGSPCIAALTAYAQAHPGVNVHYTVPLCGTYVDPAATEIGVPAANADAEAVCAAMEYLPALQKLSFNGGTVPVKVIEKLLSDYPALELSYSVECAGKVLSCDTETLDLCDVSSAQLGEVCSAISVLPRLTIVCLNPASHQGVDTSADPETAEEPGSDIVFSEAVTNALLADCPYTPITWKPEGTNTSKAGSWSLKDVAKLQQAKPGLIVDFPVKAFGLSFSTATDVLTLSGMAMSKQIDQLYELVPYLTNCSLVEMEDCGIGNEDMATIRDKVAELQPYAPINVVWRIKCGSYTCRTDAVMIKFSGKTALKDKSAEVLQYCTKIRYLDLGHNHLTKMNFVSYMPDLEVAILGVGYFKDCSPLANCPKLEYLELESGILSDISVLSGLTNLEHLNISYNVLTDLSPLYSLTKLKRAWISRNKFPEEQIETLKQLLPDCNINTTAHDPTSQGWRKLNGVCDPRYQLLREQFVYTNSHLRSYYIKQGRIVPYLT